MKIKGILQVDGEGISLDIVNKKGEIVIKGRRYLEKDINDNMIIFTHIFGILTVGAKFEKALDFHRLTRVQIFYEAKMIKI